MKVRSITLIILTFLMQAACSFNPAKINGAPNDGYRRLQLELDRKIPKLLKKNDLASMVVLLLDDQQTIYAKGFGFSDIENNTLTTTDTAYRIGSISKLFTATAIMQLHEQGQLDIDKPLKEYLPDFAIKTVYGIEDITIRSVLSHYSGLPSDYDKGFTQYSEEQNIVRNLANEHVAYKPGSVHAYSNLGYGLLGQVIKQVSNQSYDEYLKEHIFEPLGMINASLGNSSVPGFALAYDEGELVTPMEIRDRAAGDIRMSASDLSLFATEMLRYNKSAEPGLTLLSRESVAEMWRPQYPHAPLKAGFDMGLGWILSHPEKSLANVSGLVWHNGSTYRYNSAMLMSLRDNLAVIVLGNSAESDKSYINEVAVQTMLAAILSKRGKMPEPHSPAGKLTNGFSPRQIRELKGRYLSNEFGDFVIRENNNRLFTEVDGQKTELVAMDNASFGIKFRLFGFIPFTPEEISDLRFQLEDHDGNKIIKLADGPSIAQRAKRQSLPVGMRRFFGTYQLTNPDDLHRELEYSTLTVGDADGYIKAEFEVDDETQSIFVEMLNENRGRIIGYGRGSGGSIYFSMDDDKHPMLRYSGLIFKKRVP